MDIYIKNKVTRSLGAFRKHLNITKLKRGHYHSHTTLYRRPASHKIFNIYIHISGLIKRNIHNNQTKALPLSHYLVRATSKSRKFLIYIHISGKKIQHYKYTSFVILYYLKFIFFLFPHQKPQQQLQSYHLSLYHNHYQQLHL